MRTTSTHAHQLQKENMIMDIAIQNQIHGVIANITESSIVGIVCIDLKGNSLQSMLSMQSINQLNLKENIPITAYIPPATIIFSTTVQSAKAVAVTNRLRGKISAIHQGALYGLVSIDLIDGTTLTGSMTNATIRQTNLTIGQEIYALIKADDVILSTCP